VEAKKFVEASINYQDSATIFEHLQRYRKAYELYLHAGENAIKAKNLEIAIENFMQAYDMTEKDNIDARKIGNLLIKNLLQLAHIQEVAQNFFVAGTLFLEAAFYIDRTPKATDDTVSEYLEASFRNYYQAATSAGETGLKSSIAYSYTLAGICAAYLKKDDLLAEINSTLSGLDSKLAQLYFQLMNRIIDCILQKTPLHLTEEPHLLELLEKSDEIHKMLDLFCKASERNVA
jgi:hypothetical protein